MILARYITKEIATIFASIVFVLIFVALSNKFVIFLAKAATGELPVNLVVEIVALYIPEIFCFLAPIAFFLATLFAFTRLHADSEAAVILTCGYNWGNLIKIAMKFALLLAMFIAYLNLVVIPDIIAYREKILADGQAVGVMHAITPGQFQISNNGNLVFYVEDLLPNGSLSKIFIANNDAIITAKRANIKQISPQEFYLILYDGQRYEGNAGTAEFRVTKFEEYGREIKYIPEPVPGYDRIKPTKNLFVSDFYGDKAELQWRFAMPIALLILTLIAIPLAKVNPRQNKYTKVVPAILIYIAYYNLMTVMKRLLGINSIPSYIGIWSVHLLFLLLALSMLAVSSGRLQQFTYNLRRRF